MNIIVLFYIKRCYNIHSMKTISLTIPNIKPVSINRAYYKRNKQLTKESRAYRTQFLQSIQNNLEDMLKFNKSFDKATDALEIELTYQIPFKKFYAKQGHISRLSGDVDNYIKLTLDFLLNEKYFDVDDRLEDQKCYNLGIDDQFITQITAKKEPADDWAIKIRVKIVKNSL